MKKNLLVLPLLAATAAAQDTPAVPAVEIPRTVTVAGDAVVEAPPDQAHLHFAVETEGEAPEETFRRHEEEVQAVLTAVRRFGIPDRDIELEGVHLHERRNDPRDAAVHVALRAVRVTTDSLRLVPELVAAVVDAGADRLEGLAYTLEDDDRFQDEALRAAFERARQKAQELASAAGARLGPVVAVAEGGLQPPAPMPFYGRGGAEVAALAMDATPGAYSTGASEVRAVVVVTFELETP